VIADLPGVSKEDIRIDVDGNVLSVSAERKLEDEEEEEEADKFHRLERLYGRIHRVVRVPGTAYLDNVAATYSDGVRKIVVPKMQHRTAQWRIQIA
jgi:HSP20 family protein